ncbi:MAG TPA: 1-(5-phosphoribosyl)-5-[(5-phosphoribosylamino)methylideneamino]imidazole-4-carboxamide isomerase [Ignavibacteriaceae bacterium]|nr:1-(5-phosphoribosyl)-5-[(5-phosphoribosylamino)methylideneamino]imidazole-4-carboxamide isomerase [Ignavibacteriaceae bacterium]
MLIIPAIDLYQNKIVRLLKGSFDFITFYKNPPLRQAKIFESLGFTVIHIVDLLGSKTGKFTELETIKQIAAETKLKIEFGGGIRDVKTASEIFGAGVEYAVIGSLSVKNKKEFELIISTYAPEKIVAAIDSKNEKIAVHGWTEDTSVSIYEHIDYCLSLGIQKYLCTDIAKDGTLQGVNVNLYKRILKKYPDIKLIASGGVKNIDNVHEVKKIDPYALIVGKAIYDEQINLEELAEVAM